MACFRHESFVGPSCYSNTGEDNITDILAVTERMQLALTESAILAAGFREAHHSLGDRHSRTVLSVPLVPRTFTDLPPSSYGTGAQSMWVILPSCGASITSSSAPVRESNKCTSLPLTPAITPCGPNASRLSQPIPQKLSERNCERPDVQFDCRL